MLRERAAPHSEVIRVIFWRIFHAVRPPMRRVRTHQEEGGLATPPTLATHPLASTSSSFIARVVTCSAVSRNLSFFFFFLAVPSVQQPAFCPQLTQPTSVLPARGGVSFSRLLFALRSYQ